MNNPTMHPHHHQLHPVPVFSFFLLFPTHWHMELPVSSPVALGIDGQAMQEMTSRLFMVSKNVAAAACSLRMLLSIRHETDKAVEKH